MVVSHSSESDTALSSSVEVIVAKVPGPGETPKGHAFQHTWTPREVPDSAALHRVRGLPTSWTAGDTTAGIMWNRMRRS